MAGKTMATAAALVAGILAAAPPVLAHERAVEILRGQQAEAPSIAVAPDEGGSRVAVYRGSANFVRAKPAPVVPTTIIGGHRIRIDALEPATNGWFIDRSGGRLVIVHCHTRQSTQTGGGRRILCNARRF